MMKANVFTIIAVLFWVSCKDNPTQDPQEQYPNSTRNAQLGNVGVPASGSASADGLTTTPSPSALPSYYANPDESPTPRPSASVTPSPNLSPAVNTKGCSEKECGPRPMMPNTLCSDGKTMSGVGPCAVQATGACGWTILKCPKDPYQNYQSR